MKKICILTGSRAEYGLLKPVMTAIDAHSKLELNILVTGTHLSPEFGHTQDQILADGFEIKEKVDIISKDDSTLAMASAIGNGVEKTAIALSRVNPDIFMVLGDRYEILAGVVAAAYMNIPVAHIHGGDSTRGGLDESARHAITKFAHIHFPATQKSAERILKLGEDSWRVSVVGAPALDTILNMPLLPKQEIVRKYGLNSNKPLIILLQHSVSTEPETAGMQIMETLEAIKELKHQTIIIYPNSDAGGRKIIRQIEKYLFLPFIKAFKSLPQIEYLSLLKFASVMVGNSSSGIIESSSFKLPVVNIGIRQEGRERSGNVIDVNHDRKNIIESIQMALYDKEFREQVNQSKNPYGDGKASQKIAEKLSEIRLKKRLLQKKITY